MSGTPKTLHEAIGNGLASAGIPATTRLIDVVEPHVRDFLAQRFAVTYLDEVWSDGKIRSLTDLWEMITGEKK